MNGAGAARAGELFAEPERQSEGDPRRVPLADRVRPRDLPEFAGQEHMLGPGAPLRAAIEADSVRSMILWGPPGTGKTTLARIVACRTRARFVPLSAVTSGIKEVKEIMALARAEAARGGRTILFVDEIHRFNKAQQDAFLPFVEDGSVVLIGATTENPSFEVIGALLSRARVFVLRSLSPAEIQEVLRRALSDTERGLGSSAVSCDTGALDEIALLAGGDARTALNLLEASCDYEASRSSAAVTAATVRAVAQRKVLRYDAAGEEHYNLISAFIKSLRASDERAALYWMARMLASGEDPLFIARRMVILASEDVGEADPTALPLAVAAQQAAHFVGMPEAEFALTQAAQHLARAGKSDAVKQAMHRAHEMVERAPTAPVPLHLRNAVTPLMRGLGYGAGYDNPHDHEGHRTGQPCLPEELR